MGARGWFWTNSVANPVLRRLLRTRLGRFLGRSLVVLRYTGHPDRDAARAGLPVRAGRPPRVDPGRPGGAHDLVRNLRSPATVELWLAGRHVRATAVAVTDREDPEECCRGLAAYAASVPRVGTLPLHDAVMVRADVR
jgi:hypothetical protein